jgi:hypothetical protein
MMTSYLGTEKINKQYFKIRSAKLKLNISLFLAAVKAINLKVSFNCVEYFILNLALRTR